MVSYDPGAKHGRLSKHPESTVTRLSLTSGVIYVRGSVDKTTKRRQS